MVIVDNYSLSLHARYTKTVAYKVKTVIGINNFLIINTNYDYWLNTK